MLYSSRFFSKIKHPRACHFSSNTPSQKPNDDSMLLPTIVVFSVFSLLACGLNIMRKEYTRPPRIKHDFDSWMLHLKMLEEAQNNLVAESSTQKKETSKNKKDDLEPRLR